MRLPDPGHDSQAGSQRRGEGELPAERDPLGGVVKGGGHLVPLVQHLGQSHVRHAQMGRLAAALTGDVQRFPVGRQCRIQVALGALHLAQVIADPHGEEALAGRPPFREHLRQVAFGLPEPAAQPVRPRQVPAHEGAHQPVLIAQ